MQITVVDTDLADGIAAGFTLSGERGQYFNTSFVITDPATGAGHYVLNNSAFDPEEGAVSLFSESDGATIRAFAEAIPDALTYADGSMVDIWALTLTANALLTIEMDAAVDPTGGSGWASAHVGMGGQTFAEIIQTGAKLFSFEFASGAESLVGTINRRVAATALIDSPLPPPPIPEPSTYLLMLAGLGGLALRKRRQVHALNPTQCGERQAGC